MNYLHALGFGLLVWSLVAFTIGRPIYIRIIWPLGIEKPLRNVIIIVLLSLIPAIGAMLLVL